MIEKAAAVVQRLLDAGRVGDASRISNKLYEYLGKHVFWEVMALVKYPVVFWNE